MQLLKPVAICIAGFPLAAHGAESVPKPLPPAPKAAQPDVKFLEYLGTLEDDGENWTDIATTALAAPKSKGDTKTEAAAKPAAESK